MNQLTHFDIHATDSERAKKFYEKVFDWKCNSYPGAEDFYQVSSSDELCKFFSVNLKSYWSS